MSTSEKPPFRLPSPFDTLSPGGRAALEMAGTRSTFRAHDLVVEAGQPARVGLLLSGELVERDAGTVTHVVRAPAVVGVSTVLAQTHSRELRARGDVDLLFISPATLGELQRDEPAFARALTTELAHEIESRATFDRTCALREEAGPFEGEAGWSPPGPYMTAPHDVFAFFIRDDPAKIAARLPPGLRTLPAMGDTWLLAFHAGVRRFPEKSGEQSVPAVDEVTALVPCLGPRMRPALYIPSMYTDGRFSLQTAREVHGLPARFGHVDRQAQSFDLFARGELLASASWQAQAPFDVTSWLGRPLARFGTFLTTGWAQIRALGLAGPRAALSSVPLFVHRKKPRDVASGINAWSVDQLVQVPLHLSTFENMRALGEPRVHLAQKIDGLGGQCVAGVSARLGISWGSARERIDYPAKRSR